MGITIREVKSKSDLKTFIYLPEKIHVNHANWVHPIYLDDREFFNPAKNSSFSYCDTILVLAMNGNEAVGRAMGIINHKYNEINNEKDARFSFIETYHDQHVFSLLIDYISGWARSRGMEKLVGPLGFSDKDPQGFLFEGIDQPIVIASNCNFPYMNDLAVEKGFAKKLDLVVYQIPVPESTPPVYAAIYERFLKNRNGFKIVEFTSRRKVKPYIRPVFDLVNLTFTQIYGFQPFTLKEMDDFANRYLFLINPRFIKLVTGPENRVVAFVIGMSDLSEGIRKARGRLIPFGFMHLLRAARKTRQLNLLLGAVHPQFQGRGLDVLMGIKMFESARNAGKTTIDSHLELEYNTKVRAEMEKAGGKVYKRYRIYQKEL